jgi:hypothetical protein
LIELIRDFESITGTHGTMEIDGRTFHTLEPPDLGNEPFQSCVPLGEYDLIPFDSPKYGKTFIMVNHDLNVYEREDSPGRPEKGRFLCLFTHYGNEVWNFVGCVGAGYSYDKEKDRLLPSTRAATAEVNAYVDREGSYRLRISHQFE